MGIDNIKVSVVVAVYNSSRYLEQNLNSICAQTFKDIEIILVDDGSTDGSDKILEKYASGDERIKVLYQREPSDGAALARNMGVSEARGGYVLVLDADDFFEEDLIEKAYNRAIDTGAEVVIYDGDLYDEQLECIRETGMIVRREFLPSDLDVFNPRENADNLFFMTMGSAWNVLFSRELINRENLRFASFHHADDFGFVYLGFATATKIAVLHERLIHYRVNNSSSQAGTLYKWPDAAAGALLSLKKELDNRDLFERYHVTFTELSIHYFDVYLERMRDYDSFEKLYLSFKNKYVRELRLDELSDEELNQSRVVRIRRRLTLLSPGEYLYDKTHKNGLFADDYLWESIPIGGKVVIYGAGKVGKRLFLELMDSDKCKVVGWADKNYERLGYPIISPTKACETKHDYVIVAIESEHIYESIRNDLIEMGEHEGSIIHYRSE